MGEAPARSASFNGQGLAAALRAFANATALRLLAIPKRKKALISHARSAVGYNPLLDGGLGNALQLEGCSQD
jgi:hypothetical protein